ncbi:hypothetical protein [Lujinxingia litoralis]|uniref:hypothetical protein n=1 Tax=Lujinxingia litoralis TaxID=2211119 RepID=UPI0011B943B9|nr:hypothetical protein [Lujinxingia litoralis]
MRRTEMTKQNARSKGYMALGSATTTVALSALLSASFLYAGVPLTAWLTYRWLRYRAEWGLRF